MSQLVNAPGGYGAGMSRVAVAIGAPIKTAAATNSNVAFANFTFFLLVGGMFLGWLFIVREKVGAVFSREAPIDQRSDA
jgi:hypothetical protein